jgi:hypothetical protein
MQLDESLALYNEISLNIIFFFIQYWKFSSSTIKDQKIFKNYVKVPAEFHEIFLQFEWSVERGLFEHKGPLWFHFAYFCPCKMNEIVANFCSDLQ